MLDAKQVEYLLIGGYAVGYHGYPRATVDLDIWIGIDPKNAEKVMAVLEEFGFWSLELTSDLFLEENRIVRMGLPPLRIEVTTTISGVEFDECYAERIIDTIDGVTVNLITQK